MKKNGFTLVELLAVVVILGIIMAVAIVSYTGNMQRSKDKTFEMAEKDFQSAASNAYIQYLSNQDLRLSNVFDDLTYSNKTTVYLKDLINYDYIKKIKNPYNTEEMCDFENSNVVIEKTVGAKDDFNYQVCLICGDNKSNTCSEPTQYTFANPTISSTTKYTTDYKTLGKNVFIAVQGEEKSVCMIRNESLHCFKNNNAEEEKIHLQQVFSDVTCQADSSQVKCITSNMNCFVYSYGDVVCNDNSTSEYCMVYSNGNVWCYSP